MKIWQLVKLRFNHHYIRVRHVPLDVRSTNFLTKLAQMMQEILTARRLIFNFRWFDYLMIHLATNTNLHNPITGFPMKTLKMWHNLKKQLFKYFSYIFMEFLKPSRDLDYGLNPFGFLLGFWFEFGLKTSQRSHWFCGFGDFKRI